MPRWLAAAALLIAVAAVWLNTWRAPFVFDDIPSVVENASIRSLGSFAWLNPPHAAGETVSGRPVLNFTFALNYAAGALDVRGYHLGNWILHAGAAWLLWSVLRRRSGFGDGLALAAALVWALHPLQTATVSSVAQRAELLAGVFILAALWTFQRQAEGGPARRRWAAASVLACLAGGATKETAVVIPLVVLLWDRFFCSGSFRAAWRAHGRLYLGYLATWLVLGWLVWGNGGRGGSAGFGTGISGPAYLLTQAWAVPHYLRLMLWPTGLVFDYGVPVITTLAPVAFTLPVLAVLLGGTAWLLARGRTLGLAGAVFFILLAPSSSFVPVSTQTVAEHRTYLALAVPAVLLCLGVRQLARRLNLPTVGFFILAGAAITGLGLAARGRNEVYASAAALWADTVAQRPGNPRAHYNLGLALLAEHRREAAERELQKAVALQPTHAFAQQQLGVLALADGDWRAAQSRFEAALAADPNYVDARVDLGQALERQGREDEALHQYKAALALQPAADIRTNVAGLLVSRGRFAEARVLLQTALTEAPDLPEAHYQLARADDGVGDPVSAEKEFRIALEQRPDFTVAAMALGNLLIRQERFGEAVPIYRALLAGAPAEYQARNNLANCLLALGRIPEAIREYERILQARPADASVRANLDIARAMLANP